MNADTTELEKDLEKTNREIDELITQIKKDEEYKERLSRRQRNWDIFLRVVIAILAVASPAFVTYATTGQAPEIYKLVAIILSGIAGASITIQTILSLQKDSVLNAVDAVDLFEARTQLEKDKKNALRTDKSYERFAKLQEALHSAEGKQKNIIVTRRKERLSEQHKSIEDKNGK